MNFENFLKPRRKKQEKDQNRIDDIKSKPIPKHICIIMDGNGRWAEKRGLPRSAGHRQGVEAIRDIIKITSELGIKYLTLYAFSTENWKRPKKEVETIMDLLVEYLNRELDNLHKNNVKIMTIGDISLLPRKVYEEIEKAVNKTRYNTGVQVNIAINYGARSEIVMAVKEIARKVASKELNLEEIDEKLISDHLYTGGIPDPDLLIRTGGDWRISNFLLYQIAYTELWFSDATLYWPDFSINNYFDAISDFQNRQRRYGGIETRKDG
ncbi:MAG: isoprenyl transferase [Caldicoprobacterales bacterium]|jgi:undecaprenyl diphosphate synthase|nr:isoprenyl transferase [Clostridiales bacterium]